MAQMECMCPSTPRNESCGSVHISACGLLAKRHRIYALNVGKAVGGGLLLHARPGGLRKERWPRRGGWWRGGGRGSPLLESASWPRTGFTSREAAGTDSGAVDGLSSSAVPSGLSVLVGSCATETTVNAQYRESRKETSLPLALRHAL